MVGTRLIGADDAERLLELVCESREFLAPWEPVRETDWYTLAAQRVVVAAALERHAAGVTVPHVITLDGEVVGRITLNEVVRGPFQSCHLGYWLGEPYTRRGVASAAVAQIMRLAFGELGLHRIQAGTLLDNVASQGVLERNGFVRFGVAPAYLQIAGRWQDHALYQALSPG